MMYVFRLSLICSLLAFVSCFAPRTAAMFNRSRVTLMSSSQTPDFPQGEAIEKIFKVGKSIQYGVLQADVDPSNVPSEEEQAVRKEAATRDLVNIDDKERGRRKLLGTVGSGVAAIAYAATFVFHLSLVPRILSIYFPIAFSVGFLTSSEKGL